MATTSLSLSPHFEAYIKKQVESGRYASASEVIRDALRDHQADQEKLERLRAHLKEGSDQARRGESIKNFNMEDVIQSALGRRA